MLKLDMRIFLLILGFLFSATGIASITGKYKRWYWNSRWVAYAYLPFGILFVLAAVGESYTGQSLFQVFYALEIILFIIAAWWAIYPPRFIRPAWIRMIEEHPKEVYQAMSITVKKGFDWRSKVDDPEALEKWILSVEKNLQRKGHIIK